MASVTPDPKPQPHAFHLNLPPHFRDKDGYPMVTTFAIRKARQAFDLAMSIKLKESFFEYNDDKKDLAGEPETNVEEDGKIQYEMEEDDDEETPLSCAEDPESFETVARRCSRLISMFSSLENLKFSGLSHYELMDVTLHLLRLVTATVSYEGKGIQRKATLHYENVGTVLHFGEAPNYESKVPQQEASFNVANSKEEFENGMRRRFALTAPCRESLLLVLMNIVGNKGYLRPVSNASVYTSDSKKRSLLILHWETFLRMLLRTAPYLDELSVGDVIMDSNSRMNTILKRTVQLTRDARHFFEQGVRPEEHRNEELIDYTAKKVWDMVETDVLFRSHTNACFRGAILLYLFHPTRSSEAFYVSVLPKWWDAWTNVDRCPEYDFLWLSLLCRARKMTVKYDWTPIRKRLLTLSQYWLQLPIGGGSLDKSFPRAGNPRTRSCPPRLKAFVGSGSSFSDSILFVGKVTKMLVTGLGTGNVTGQSQAGELGLSDGTRDVLRFFAFVAPYFNPSNVGHWTFTLGAFLHNFSYELCCRIGAIAGREALLKTHPQAVEAFGNEQVFYETTIPPHEIAQIINGMLPLCQQALYSKSNHVSRAGEAAMLYLVQIDPEHTTPSFLDFASRALDISAVNLSHQAPVALSVLARLVQPGLRSNPKILFSRLPQILSLTLAGIDTNDQNKTIRTLIFYRSLTSWVPVGSSFQGQAVAVDQNGEDGTLRLSEDLHGSISAWRKSKAYLDAIASLPPTSPMHQNTFSDDSEFESVLEEVSSVMSDWALEFLERIFGLLRGSGETEKASKRASGVARHSSADVLQARNFSRVLKECMVQVFISMDDETYNVALRRLTRFIEEETHPSAAKEAACLCQAAASTRSMGSNQGLDTFVPLLTGSLTDHSAKTMVYRVRCLTGVVRAAGLAILQHKAEISSTIDFCMKSEDKHLFKAGCKLLRHTLSACVESYPLAFDAKPRFYTGASSLPGIGRSAQICSDPIQWHVPTDDLHQFAIALLQSHLISQLEAFGGSKSAESPGFLARCSNLNHLRRCLRVLRYSLRGGASVLLEFQTIEPELEDFVPYEQACFMVLSESSRSMLSSLRTKLCTFVACVASIITADSFFPGEMASLPDENLFKKNVAALAADAKICKEICDIGVLLMTRRGSGFRSQEARSVWKAQRQLASDFVLCSTADYMSEVLQCTSLYGDTSVMLYKDGEDAGKTIPRRLLLARVKIFHDSLQRSASFQIPRRLRRLDRSMGSTRARQFIVGDSVSTFVQYVEESFGTTPSPMEAYERLTDCLYAFACHNNSQVRISALSVVEYSSTRFGWLVGSRVPRLLSALTLNDERSNGKFGVPSCANLSSFVDNIGKRKLAEALKGICSILSLSRHMRHLLQTEKSRCLFVETLFRTEKAVALLPGEETQKFVNYLQALFTPFRSKFYSSHRVSPEDVTSHNAMINMSLSSLSENSASPSVSEESEGVPHWRKKLLSCWVLLSVLDDMDYANFDEAMVTNVWTTCFHSIESEKGQPLQRLALGLLGRLIQFPLGALPGTFVKVTDEGFCEVLGDALVYDHKEDTSVGSGHESQWTFGIEDYIRDAARNIAPRTMFPFQRTSQAFGAFKPSHSQLIVALLSLLDGDQASATAKHLLKFAKKCAGAPPSEDFRNQQAAAAEIFAAVCRYHLVTAKGSNQAQLWAAVLLPHLDDVMNKIPFSLSGAYFDAIRFSFQFCPAECFPPLTKWLGTKIEDTLWKVSDPSIPSNDQETGATTSDGFTSQSKWLYLFSSLLIEMSVPGSGQPNCWYQEQLYRDSIVEREAEQSLDTTQWDYVITTIVPRLFGALSHPFDSCRDHLSRVLFRISYECSRHKKMQSHMDLSGCSFTEGFARLEDSESTSGVHRLNALSTTRRFISYCVHLGESKFEYSDFIIKLLPAAFSAVGSNSSTEEVSSEDQITVRAMESDVIKGYRSLLAEVSITSVISYGSTADIFRVLDVVEDAYGSSSWQVRHAAAHFLRCFQSVHQFLFTADLTIRSLELIAGILSDDRREVSSAAMAALTGVLAVSPTDEVSELVEKYRKLAGKSKLRRPKKATVPPEQQKSEEQIRQLDLKRAHNQRTAVFFLCAAVMAHPYETPRYVPVALAAISKHSFERNAPLGVREVVKRCCAEYKKTHMSDDWERHRKVFSSEELDALEDVISSPHYYA